MKKQIQYFIFLTLMTTSLMFSQEKFTISGNVYDINNNETLIGVNIFIKELKTGVPTNEYGFFSISVPKGEYTLQISYMGYQDMVEKVLLDKNIKLNLKLKDDSKQLDEVIVKSDKKKINIRKPEMSTNKLSIQEIKKMPAVMGEVDVLKSILQLPGVTNSGEGSAGFNVRGGSADQNLVLLDGASIFNTSHLFGFFSIFNSDAIKDLKLYKGGIPARFGGRVSSVLDIYQKDGNSNEFHMNGGIGTVSSRLLAEGPIVKDKGSFVIAGRGSYAHLFLKLTDNKNSAYFYDFNTKLNYKLNDNNNVYLSGYFGRDVFAINNEFNNIFGNTIVNTRWNHLFSEKIFSNLSLIYSNYNNKFSVKSRLLDWDTDISSYNLKYDISHYWNDKLKLNYGLNLISYNFNPGTIKPSSTQSPVNFQQLEKKHALEPALYFQVEQEVTKKLSINYGLRYSLFYRLGNQTMNVYANNQAVVYNPILKIYEGATPINTQFFSKGEVIAQYGNLEPRVALAFELSENQSIKASYNRMSQYVHLISNSTSATPLDVWAPSDKFLKPQILDQVALGYFRNFKEGDYSIETETFYKTVKNRADYIDGADLVANDAIERVLLNGKARSYGIEILFRKNSGKFTGFTSYTLSRSEQKTEGRTAIETGINNGNWYLASYDKLHNLSITGNYELNKKWNFGGIFTLQSGKPVTYPNSQYVYGDINVPYYEPRNKSRITPFHHLDLSATYVPKPDKKQGWKSEWVFSIYNVYNRKNAASISFGQNEDTGANEATRLSIFGVIPSVTYNFKF